MLLRMTINTQPNSFGYYADEIEVPNAYHQADITVTIGVVFSLMFWLCCGFFVYFNWLGLCVCFRTWVPKYACNERYIKSQFCKLVPTDQIGLYLGRMRLPVLIS